MTTASDIRELLTCWFTDEGLLFLGVVDLDVSADFVRFESWLDEGRAAEMNFLHEHLEVRSDPTKILPGAKTAMIVGYQYSSREQESKQDGHGLIARYARTKDYHKFMREKCQRVVDKISAQPSLSTTQFRIAVDSAPILERALASKTASGFIGKNTCFIHPDLGSFMLLAEIFSDLNLSLDTPADVTPSERTESGGCGSCKRCQVYCPTGALSRDYSIDAKKCIAYWTIEHRGPIPVEHWPWLKDYVFGCDICQNVCPYNRKSETSSQPMPTRVEANVDLFELATLSQEDYVRRFGGTPVTRAKREGLRRNALIAMYVNQDVRLDKALAHVEKDPHEVLVQTRDEILRFAKDGVTDNSYL